MLRKTRAAAALMCLLLLLSLTAGCQKEKTFKVNAPKTAALALPRYRTETVEYTLPEEARVPYREGLQPYLRTMIPVLLADAGEENAACSPLNIYMALAMLAEITDGESRAQLEALLGAETPQLRDWASDLWQKNYHTVGDSQVLLGASLWLNEGMTFKKDTLNLLADRYYAAVYQGKMGSEAFSRTYRDWMNEHTGGLLADQISGMSLPENLALNLTATVYFTGSWSEPFNENRTLQQIFYAPDGETRVPMMKKSKNMAYYWGERFTAVSLPMNLGRMWFILPDEGYTPADLLADEQAMDFLLCGGEWEDKRQLKVHLSVPRFDIADQMQLIGDLQALGVSAVFQTESSDFSPVTDEHGLSVSRIIHGVRVKIDEEKVEAAAYTSVTAPTAALPQELEEIDFTLDRPFLFTITGFDNMPLFTGIVNRP